jgi:hypothetical protein
MNHHTIVSTPVCDESTGKWKFSPSVSWPSSETAREVRFFTNSPEIFLRFEDAEEAWLEAGKNWVEGDYKKTLARNVDFRSAS